MTADEEEIHNIAPANTPFDEKTGEFVETDAHGNLIKPERIIARTRDFATRRFSWAFSSTPATFST